MASQERMSAADYRAGARKPAKYRNQRVRVDGFSFDSKAEAKRYGELKELQAVGAIAWFLCQVPFRLPGGIIYRADFLIVWNDMQFNKSFTRSKVTVEDVKGMMTSASRLKIKQVQAIYGIEVELVTGKGAR
jgi:hypothetical protein